MEEYVYDPSNPLKLKRKFETDSADENIVESFPSKSKRSKLKDYNFLDDDSDNDGAEIYDSDYSGENDNVQEDDTSDISASSNKTNSKKRKTIRLMDMKQFKEENLENLQSDGDDLQPQDNVNKIVKFNVDEELENGIFDKDGNYIEVESKNDEEKWMDEVENIESVAAAKAKQYKFNRERQQRSQRKGRHYMIDEALYRLQFLVSTNGDTVLQTLGKLNKLRKSYEDATDNTDAVRYITNSIELLMDLTEILQRKGYDDVYSLNRKNIIDSIEEESLTDQFKIDFRKNKIWSFKWLNKTDKISEYYTCYEMNYWKKTFFKGNVIVKFKDEKDEMKNWLHISCLEFM
ncbi:hypothetical protein KAFR_0A08480 [Kazachstania africana CBS 2517]|uniref:GYF domain-containing protein n=1 Tax=Kazachstania africana (strain ATCC 22294 / BCRC 22015 / CBS 2517 / CECT 1963 / NBRC 1671 / NRRL Y-8276) TaxID=1071382 RepID=H2API2_KAZAF|nr:hypothetical protein KAFR_0A08480 [Kazachstania africana CBS 2517]CCF56282.1 hypothetical protein KAFR_0A08480 [Kazachstania africana CBS 2517]